MTFAARFPQSVDRVMTVSCPLDYAAVNTRLRTASAVELSEWLDYAVARVPLMQAGTATDAQGRILEQEDDSKKKTRDVQRPRVFYRSNIEARQMIIARP